MPLMVPLITDQFPAVAPIPASPTTCRRLIGDESAVGAGTTAGTTAATWIASSFASVAGNLGAQQAPQLAQYVHNAMKLIAQQVSQSGGACRAAKEPETCKRGGPTKSGGNSFAAGTVVFTSRGLKPIEDVEVGDLVAAWNPDTDRHDWKPVTARSSRQADAVFKLTVRAEDGREETVVVTPNHPYLLAANDNGPGGVETVVQMVPGGGWTAAGFLKPGDQIRSVANGSLTVVAAELDQSKTRVYTLEVADSHTYAVGDLQAWVHNAKKYTKPPNPNTKNKKRKEACRERNIGIDEEHSIRPKGGPRGGRVGGK
jgi:hypothetical protein